MGNSNGRIVHHLLVRLAMKAQSVCGQKRNAVFALPPASYEPATAATNHFVGVSLVGS